MTRLFCVLLTLLFSLSGPAMAAESASAYVYGGYLTQTAMANSLVSGAVTWGTGAVAVGTGYGLLTDQEFRSDYVAMEMASPFPGEGTAMFARGLGMAGRDAQMGLAAYWNSMKPAMGEGVEQLLYRSGGLAYAVPPGKIPDDLEGQLARLYKIGLERQSLLQKAVTPQSLIIPQFPGSTMVDITNLRPFPGGRSSYSPLKLMNHGSFDWSKFTHPIEIQYVNGVPYIMGGMTRVENALRSGITKLPALIYGR
jgi:hypothetical protein